MAWDKHSSPPVRNDSVSLSVLKDAVFALLDPCHSPGPGEGVLENALHVWVWRDWGESVLQERASQWVQIPTALYNGDCMDAHPLHILTLIDLEYSIQDYLFIITHVIQIK